jgi:hypothetical protein
MLIGIHVKVTIRSLIASEDMKTFVTDRMCLLKMKVITTRVFPHRDNTMITASKTVRRTLLAVGIFCEYS